MRPGHCTALRERRTCTVHSLIRSNGRLPKESVATEKDRQTPHLWHHVFCTKCGRRHQGGQHTLDRHFLSMKGDNKAHKMHFLVFVF
ncbi:hypothetical protein pqer_cds_729 [Pandoravirus quercus]|uniref:Uncharacterized protein n=2 Tax=Pandoravirus TaxID=2060084 RepID=A0A2U7U9N2_9VIRU|nr:hypothetical protein pqer_cds_729 [Pandoravirus quercus]AVK75151.1 hypothetical protein pqer_cds_729 [Pandoravirus quercus]QBZ81316.1 hypothetical protein pclt_cds_730 [Pandoravirus celtis]